MIGMAVGDRDSPTVPVGPSISCADYQFRHAELQDHLAPRAVRPGDRA